MAMDASVLLQSAPQLFRDLPFLINLAQFIFYAGLALTFGGFVMKGYRGHASAVQQVLGRVVFGILAVVTGLGIAWLIPYLTNIPVYTILQRVFLNVIPGGIIATAVLYGSLKMMSYHIFNIPGIEQQISKLTELKKTAHKVRAEEKKQGRHGIKHPVRIAGLALFVGFLAFGLAGFKGLPDPMEEMGFSGEDLENMATQLEDINEQYGDRISDIMGSDNLEECMGAATLLNDQSAIEQAERYENPEVRAMIEDYSNETVTVMMGIQTSEGFYVFSMGRTKACIASLNVVCACDEL